MNGKIIELIRSQKDEGLRLLQQQYSGLMHYTVGSILQNQNDIEECISDICIKVWHSIDSSNCRRAWNDRALRRGKTIPSAKKAAKEIGR